MIFNSIVRIQRNYRRKRARAYIATVGKGGVVDAAKRAQFKLSVAELMRSKNIRGRMTDVYAANESFDALQVRALKDSSTYSSTSKERRTFVF